MSFSRKVERRQQAKQRKAWRNQLVKEGKKLQLNLKTNRLEIVDVKKPYRKEN